MDPLIIHHVIRHPLSRIETNNFQDKSGCSINGIRYFLFEEGIFEDLDDVERIRYNSFTIQDYRGYPIELEIDYFYTFPLSDEILRMKNVRFDFEDQQFKPIHKLVSPEPHFVEEERNLIENHFEYLVPPDNREDIEDWDCFDMDSEGHLVSLKSSEFELSNESIEHLSNFPHLRHLQIWPSISIKESVTNFSNFSYLRNLDIFSSTSINQAVTNLSLLSSLNSLTIGFEGEFEDQDLFDDLELLKDLGLFSNLISLNLYSNYGFKKLQIDSFPLSLKNILNCLLVLIILPSSFSTLTNLASLCLTNFTLQGF